MTTKVEAFFISVCLERFFYGKILVLCASICTLAKEVQLFPGLGLYSGIFACIYNAYRESPAIILFYAVFLLYVLSTASFVGDLVTLIFEVSNILSVRIPFLSVVQWRIGTLSLQLQIDSQPMLSRLSIVRTTASGCCDFLAQCILVRINYSSVLFT